MNIVTALLESLTALLEYLDLVCNFLKGGWAFAPNAPSWIRHCINSQVVTVTSLFR